MSDKNKEQEEEMPPIEPIPDTFENVAKAVVQPLKGPKKPSK